MEDALKNRVVKLAWLNYNHLGTFIRLIDYMVVETQVRINQEAAELIVSEMDREDRKYALQTVVGFDLTSEDGLSFTPTKTELASHLEKLLDDMQLVTEEVQRVINHNEFHQFIHGLITDSGPRFRTIVDESDKYKDVRKEIAERLQLDFSHIEEKTKVFKTCIDIYNFSETFNFEEFKEQNQDLEQVKLMFEKLAKWDAAINKITNEQKRGLFTASGRKLREKLQTRIKREQDNLRSYLFEMAGNTDREITNGLAKMKETLTKPISNLNSYVEYVNRLQNSKSTFVKLQDQKKKLEEMKAVLGKYRVKDENAYTNSSKISQLQAKIDLLGDELYTVEDVIKKAEETATQNKDDNTASLTTVIIDEQTKITELIGKIESDTLMSKITPHKDAIFELKKLEQTFDKSLEKIEQFRTFESTLGVTAAVIPQIEQFQAKFQRREKIWKNWDAFQKLKSDWYMGNFKAQDAENIVKTVNKFGKENMNLAMQM
jgi:hypothetical protein